MTQKRTFREKLTDDKDFPRVQKLSGGMEKRWGPGTIVLPAISEVKALMDKVPRGRIATINQIRETLARRHNATMACPIVTGIHARIVAGAAGEDQANGRKQVTPYWRTLKSTGELNLKYPGGIQGQRARLIDEGLAVIKRGKTWYVDDYETYQADLG